MLLEPTGPRRPRDPAVERLAVQLADAKRANHHRTLILGAGASRAAGLPDWNQLCERLIRVYRLPHEEGDDPVKSVQKYYARPSHPPFLAVSRVIGPMRPTIGYLHLAQLLEKGVFDLVLSTNWDPLVELALAEMAPTHHCQVLIRGQVREDLMVKYLRRPPAANMLIKLHGDLSAKLFLAITEEEISKIPDALARELRDRLGDQVVIVGHSLRDPDIATLLRMRPQGGGVTYAAPHSPEPQSLANCGLNDATIVSDSSGFFDEFMGDLHGAYASAPFEVDPVLRFGEDPMPRLEGVIDRMRLDSEWGTGYLNNASTRDKIGEMFLELNSINPHLVLFIDDATAPGGSEIRRWMYHEDPSAAWREGNAIVTRERPDDPNKPPHIDLSDVEAALASGQVGRIAVVDSCSFSGLTMLEVGRRIHEEIERLAPGRRVALAALLLALHPSARGALEGATVPGGNGRRLFHDVASVMPLNRHEMTFPWGTTELTSTLDFEVVDLNGSMRLETRGKRWGFSQLLAGPEARTVRLNTLRPGAAFSFHRHVLRSELFVPLDEGIRMRLSARRPSADENSREDSEITTIMLESMQPVLVPRGVWHQLLAPRQQQVRVLEVGFGLYDEDADHDVARSGRRGPYRQAPGSGLA